MTAGHLERNLSFASHDQRNKPISKQPVWKKLKMIYMKLLELLEQTLLIMKVRTQTKPRSPWGMARHHNYSVEGHTPGKK
jgi:hypothetical protein